MKVATYRNLPERFYALVQKRDDGCWAWVGGTGGKGATRYGIFRIMRDARHTSAHRVAWELERGSIPKGLVLDHLCGNTLCVNPEHLEPVTATENRRRQSERKTRCVRGHPLSGPNLYVDSRGHRSCRECRRTRKLRLTDEQRTVLRERHAAYMRRWKAKA